MTLTELESVVALICGRRVKFEMVSNNLRGKYKWVAHMYTPHRMDEDQWIQNKGWHASGPTYKQAMEETERRALKWADEVNAF